MGSLVPRPCVVVVGLGCTCEGAIGSFCAKEAEIPAEKAWIRPDDHVDARPYYKYCGHTRGPAWLGVAGVGAGLPSLGPGVCWKWFWVGRL